jgi:hypothetical protein
MTTPNLDLDELVASQTQPHVPINSSLRRLDAAVNLSVIAIQNAPPEDGSPIVTPTDGDRYIVGTSPSGDWVGHANDIAAYIGTDWEFLSPQRGWLAYNRDDGDLYLYGDGSPLGWDVFAPGSVGGNGWTLVDTETASASSSLDFTVIDSAAYDQYMIVLEDLVLGTSGAELALVAGTGGGPTWDTAANYDFFISWHYGTSSTGTVSSAFVSATNDMRFGTVASGSSPHGKPMTGDALITGLPSGSYLRVSKGMTDVDGSGGLTSVRFSGVYNQTTDITGLRLIPSTGTITSGKARLLGRNF